jgi:hypothetical protein
MILPLQLHLLNYQPHPLMENPAKQVICQPITQQFINPLAYSLTQWYLFHRLRSFLLSKFDDLKGQAKPPLFTGIVGLHLENRALERICIKD